MLHDKGEIKLRYRRIGSTDLKISEIGFGTWGIGSDRGEGLSYGPQDDQSSIDALEKAYQLGVIFFDTAELYGDGHSERLLGGVFNERRKEIIIATKVGYINHYEQDFSSRRVEQALYGSLKRLRTDYVDLYQLHNPLPEFLCNAHELFGLLTKFREKGVIRAIGVSAQSPDEALKIIEYCDPDCIQVNMNLTDMRALTNGLLRKCQDKNIGVIIRSPMALGFLSGKITSETKFHFKDHRNRFSKKQLNIWSRAANLYRQVWKELPEATDAQNALRFCLSHPAVSTVIPGMHTVSEVEENIQAVALSLLDERQLEQVMEIYRQHTFFVVGNKIESEQ